MRELDFKRARREWYAATEQPALIEVPSLPFLMIDGAGDPDAPRYAESVAALYSMAYTIRFALKRAEVITYPVPPLEGLWWTDAFSDVPEHLRRDEWKWTMLIPQPPQATDEVFAAALATAARKRGASPRLDAVRLADFAEGPAAQILHRGPYRTEPETTRRLDRFVAERGLRYTGFHHEIYLSDPRRVAEAKLRTILRYGVGPAAP